MRQSLGIYIHIPFCASKCSYCDFYSLAGCEGLIPSYQDALLEHLDESGPSIKKYEVDTVYFGGGTPSFYGADRICELFNAVKMNGNVRLDAEVTVEVNPDSISLNALRLLRGEGVNRLSIGVQASDNNLLKLIGRRHNFQQAQKAVYNARMAGFDNVSIDLMYGLPSQTKSDWAETLARTMYCYAAEMLDRYGYKQYEISNFCAPGFESRHNLKYWRLDDYMGFGPGAHSSVGNLRYSFVKDLRRYISGVQRKLSITDEYQVIDPLERAVEYIMLGMRTTRGISEQEYHIRCQSNWKPIARTLEAFRQKGWTELESDGRWHFTVPGFLISNTLIGILLEAQASGRIEGTPWLHDAYEAEEKIHVPKSEEELFTELYQQTVSEE